MTTNSFRFDDETTAMLAAIQRRHHCRDRSEAVRISIRGFHDAQVPAPIHPILGELPLVKQLLKAAQAGLDLVTAVTNHFPITSTTDPRLEEVQMQLVRTAAASEPSLRAAVASIMVCFRAATTEHDIQALCRALGALLHCRAHIDRVAQNPTRSPDDRRRSAEISRQLSMIISFLESCGIRYRPSDGASPDTKAT